MALVASSLCLYRFRCYSGHVVAIRRSSQLPAIICGAQWSFWQQLDLNVSFASSVHRYWMLLVVYLNAMQPPQLLLVPSPINLSLSWREPSVSYLFDWLTFSAASAISWCYASTLSIGSWYLYTSALYHRICYLLIWSSSSRVVGLWSYAMSSRLRLLPNVMHLLFVALILKIDRALLWSL